LGVPEDPGNKVRRMGKALTKYTTEDKTEPARITPPREKKIKKKGRAVGWGCELWEN